MDVTLAWFECKMCDKRFMSYVQGSYKYLDNGDWLFIRNDGKDITDNSYLYPIKGERFCGIHYKNTVIDSYV